MPCCCACVCVVVVHCGASCPPPPPPPPPPLCLFCSHVDKPTLHRAACSHSAIDANAGRGLLRPRAVTPAVVVIMVGGGGGESGRLLRGATDPPRLFVSSCEQMELLLSPSKSDAGANIGACRCCKSMHVLLLELFVLLPSPQPPLVWQIRLLTALISAAVMGSARVFAQLSRFWVFGQDSRSGFTGSTGVTIPTRLTFGSMQSLQGGHRRPKEADELSGCVKFCSLRVIKCILDFSLPQYVIIPGCFSALFGAWRSFKHSWRIYSPSIRCGLTWAPFC